MRKSGHLQNKGIFLVKKERYKVGLLETKAGKSSRGHYAFANQHILRWYTWITRVQRQENPATVFYCWSHLTRRTCKPVISTMVALSSVSSSPLSIPTPSVRIPHICHFFYTHTFFVQKILHSKVREFTTKKASRQNSINLRHKLPCDKIA